jgi:hypothetical protein
LKHRHQHLNYSERIIALSVLRGVKLHCYIVKKHVFLMSVGGLRVETNFVAWK